MILIRHHKELGIVKFYSLGGFKSSVGFNRINLNAYSSFIPAKIVGTVFLVFIGILCETTFSLMGHVDRSKANGGQSLMIGWGLGLCFALLTTGSLVTLFRTAFNNCNPSFV